MLNSIAKVFNKNPKPNSKTQKAKAKALEKQTITYVECAECKRHDITLYKSNGKHYCSEHRPS